MSTETIAEVQTPEITDQISEEIVSQVNVDARGQVLTDEDRKQLEGLAADINTFLADNQDITTWTAEQKDAAYKVITDKWNEYQKFLRGVEYNYYATKKEYKFLRNLILAEMSYGPNEIFVAMRVRENLITVADKALQAIGKNDRFTFKVKIDDLTIAYHLIEKYQVKGLGDTAYLFANTLKTIGDISIIFNSFDKHSKHLSELIGNWCAGLDTPDAEEAGTDNTSVTTTETIVQ